MADPILTPRSKLRASLAKYDSSSDDDDTPNPPTTDTNAYDRVKKLLLQPETQATTNNTTATTTTSTSSQVASHKPAFGHVSRITSSLFAPPSEALKAAFSASHPPAVPSSPPAEEPQSSSDASSSESDLPEDPRQSRRFQELVQRKRKEREEKEAAAARQREEERARARQEAENQEPLPDYEDPDDDSPTTHAPSARKASKKALQEMAKETQRMSRNMQLTHEAKTRKAFSKGNLFSCFEYDSPHSDSQQHEQAPSDSVSAHNDNQALPPLSLSRVEGNTTRPRTAPEASQINSHLDDHDLPPTDALFAPSTSPTLLQPTLPKITIPPKRRVKLPPNVFQTGDDSDSELEIEKAPEPKRASLFDRVQSKETQSSSTFLKLRQLAHLDSKVDRHGEKGQITSFVDLGNSLQRRAREQAAEAREERLQQLRDRGVVLPTAEEMAKDEEAIDDLITKARDEADALRRKEQAASKKAKKDHETDAVDIYDSEEDADWEGEDRGMTGSNADGHDTDASNSEGPSDEEIEEDGDQVESDEEDLEDGRRPNLIDEEAAEVSDDETVDEVTFEETEQRNPGLGSRRRPKHLRIVSDDEDEVAEPSRPMIPGLPRSDAPLLGMTQMFAGSMDDTQLVQPFQPAFDSPREPNPLYMPGLAAALSRAEAPFEIREDTPDVIRDSQGHDHAQVRSNANIDNVVHDGAPSTSPEPSSYDDSPTKHLSTQMSQIPDPTQDVGFMRSSVTPERFGTGPPSTIDTLPMEPSPILSDSPIKKKGRLLRRVDFNIHRDESRSQPHRGDDDEELDVQPNAFEAMRRSKKRLPLEEIYDKKASEAKEMFEEQAEESEDEYAGLGGVSDEDSDDEEEVRDILDETEQATDEADIAAFHADKERASDEKAVQKLYKDITNGALRKKRGAAYDLSDSEDDGEARRAKKRRDFAKMRKALLEDKNVEKIASDPKKAAFLRAIEDRDETERYEEVMSYGSQNGTSIIPDSQTSMFGSSWRVKPRINPVGSPRKRRLSTEEAPASNKRRYVSHPLDDMNEATAIRQGLQELIDDPQSFVYEEALVGATNDASPNKAPSINDGSIKNPRRSKGVVDRAQLLRAQSTTNKASSSGRMAFQVPGAPAFGSGGFGVPGLLRRATTSQLGFNHAGAFAGGPMATTERLAGLDPAAAAGANKASVPKRGGQASCSINYFSRQLERKRGLDEQENERASKRMNLGVGRRTVLSAISRSVFE